MAKIRQAVMLHIILCSSADSIGTISNELQIAVLVVFK
jgi:hypothetical protein